jgi:hypothetical protein
MLNFYIYMTTKYILLTVIIMSIACFGFYASVAKPPIVTDNETKNQEVVAAINPVPTIIPKTTETPKVVEIPLSAVSNKTKKPTLTTVDGIPVSVGYAEFPPEVDSVAGLISISDNIFIGKVLKNEGDDPGHFIPSTRFDVIALGNIKGNISGKISFLQGGVGYSSKNGKFYIGEDDILRIASGKINPDDVFLKIGATYLFMAGYDVKKDIYGIGAPPHDRELLTADNTLNNAQLLTIAENNPRVQEFMKVAGITSLRGAE